MRSKVKKGMWVYIKVGDRGYTLRFNTELHGANARILKILDDGALQVHWAGNYNTFGDFQSELMTFRPIYKLDIEDEKNRNDWRTANGLLPIK